MALTPTPDSPLKNEGKVLRPTALGPTSGTTPSTAVPMMSQDVLVLVPPEYSLPDPRTGALIKYEAFWEEYARLIYGASGVNLATNLDALVNALEHRNVGRLV